MYLHAGSLDSRSRLTPQPIRDDKGRPMPAQEVFDRWDAQRAARKPPKDSWLSSVLASLCGPKPKADATR